MRQLREAISTTTTFCRERKIDPAKIRDARGFEREKLKEDAVAAFVVNDETRRQYLNLAAAVDSIFKSLLPDAAASEFSPICNVFKVVAEKIRSELPVVDISAVMADVEALLNRSIAAGGYVMPPVSNDPSRYIDLSQVDFEALKKQFDKGRKPIEVQKLRAKIALKLALMVKLNKTRLDFLEEFQRMIDEYNAGSSNVETFFAKLMAFTKKLNGEEETWACGATDGGRTRDLRSADEAEHHAHEAGDRRSEEGGEVATGEAEAGEAGARLAEAADHPRDGARDHSGHSERASTGVLEGTVRSEM